MNSIKALLSSLLFLLISFSLNAQCNYSVVLYADWDGWYGSEVTINVAGSDKEIRAFIFERHPAMDLKHTTFLLTQEILFMQHLLQIHGLTDASIIFMMQMEIRSFLMV